ncbi:MAG TPA: hypothetical protein VK671_15255 [Mucilaginibacter sp.]|jgi:hypothetical protein|nr:hypothetical protein [Mucilaginibacter sp.]
MKIQSYFFLTWLLLSLYCCNIDYAPSTISNSVNESKDKGFFLGEYKVDSLVVYDKNKLFIIQKVWIEKQHTSTTDSWGNDTYKVFDKSSKIVFNMSSDSYYNNGNYMQNWIMLDSRGTYPGLFGTKVSDNDFTEKIPQSIRFKAFMLKRPNSVTMDTVKIAEFVLRKK